MKRQKEIRAEALKFLERIQLTLELTGDLRAETVSELKTAVASTKKRVARAAKASPSEGKERKRRSN